MSNFGRMSGPSQQGAPTQPRGEVIARYTDYLQAQRAVDYLSDSHFPVQMVTIVGTGLRMVERVIGRLSYPRVAMAGAASGAWFGLFVGFLLNVFGNAPGALFAAPLFGAAFGILYGVISYALTRGRRDFTSTSQIVASEYEVLCLPEQANAARDLLHRLNSGGGSGMPPGAGATVSPVERSGGQIAPEPAAPPAPGVQLAGPTYGEMIEKQRLRERAERDQRAEQERQETEGENH